MQNEGITSSYNGRNIMHVLPAFGPNLYWEAGRKIFSTGLSVPTGEYTANLLHEIYCGSAQSDKADEVKKILNDKWLWVFNRNIWTPKGLFVIPDCTVHSLEKLEGKDNDPFAFPIALEHKLEGGRVLENGVRFSPDNTVRFAPKETFGAETYEVEASELDKDGVVLANYGERGASLLAKVAQNLQTRAEISAVDLDDAFYGTFNENIVCQRDKVGYVSCPNGKKLHVGGTRIDGSIGRGTGGYAFGVSI